MFETRVLAPSSDRDLASIGTLSETIALEVVGSTLHVDTVRGELSLGLCCPDQ